MLIFYENDIWELHLFIRESLFPDYRRIYPEENLRITKGSETKSIKAKDVKLYSEWRNTP